MQIKSFASYGVKFCNNGVDLGNSCINPSILFFMGFDCLELVLLKGLGLIFGISRTFAFSRVSWASLALIW